MKKKSKNKDVPAVRRSTELSVGGPVSISDLVNPFNDDDLSDQEQSDSEYSSRQSFYRLGPMNWLRLCDRRAGSRILYKEAFRHGVKDKGDGKWGVFSCPAKLRPPGRCYICEVLAAYGRRAKKKADIKEYNEQLPRWGAYWNVIDMKNPSAGAMLAWFPGQIHKWIKKETGIAEREIDKRPWDLEEGFPLRITGEEGRNPYYECRFFEKKAERLEDECYLGMADLEKAAAVVTPVELFKVAYHMAEAYDLLDEMDWDDVYEELGVGKKKRKKSKKRDEEEDEEDESEEEDEEDEDEPKKSSKKSSSKKRKDEDDEDEDEEDEDEDEDEDDEDYKPVRGHKKARVRGGVVEPIVEVPKSKSKKKSPFDSTDDGDPWASFGGSSKSKKSKSK